MIERIWYGNDAASAVARVALSPLSAAFGLAVGVRSLAYAGGVRFTHRAWAPVVSVGALTVGGAGKTPFVLWLARSLAARGLRPCIVTRGYGGSSRALRLVLPEHGTDASVVEAVGDEAALLAVRSGQPVAVGRRRADACALARKMLVADLLILDDGFQHQALARDLDIVLLEGTEDSQYLLPAGPLRERLSAASRADVLVATSDGAAAMASRAGLATRALRGRTRPVALVAAVSDEAGEPLARLGGLRIAAVAAIARPQRFLSMLESSGATVTQTLLLRDHHRYTSEDWRGVEALGDRVDMVVTTEKDLIKLAAFSASPPAWLKALRIEQELEGERPLLDRIETLATTRTSARQN